MDNSANRNRVGWTWPDWLTAAGLYHTIDPQVTDTERYHKLTKAWEQCINPYKYKED